MKQWQFLLLLGLAGGLASCEEEGSPRDGDLQDVTAAQPGDAGNRPESQQGDAGTRTMRCDSTETGSVCREFTGPGDSGEWETRDSICSTLQGAWEAGACAREGVVATCTKEEGDLRTTMLCYDRPDNPDSMDAFGCQTACMDDGIYEGP